MSLTELLILMGALWYASGFFPSLIWMLLLWDKKDWPFTPVDFIVIAIGSLFGPIWWDSVSFVFSFFLKNGRLPTQEELGFQ